MSKKQSWGCVTCVRVMENRKDVMYIDSLKNQNGGFLALMVSVRVGGQDCIQVYPVFLWLGYL